MTDTADRIARSIAAEIDARPAQVTAAVTLLDGGATVPFIARYRKEVTGGLDDTQLRNLADRLAYLRELEARRGVILGSIKEQGKLTDALARAIAGAETKAALEDIYLPFKPKRRTKAMIARENGLEPLLQAILADRNVPPEALAAGYLSDAVPGVKEALDGARDILVEDLSENAALLGRLRDFMRAEALITAKVVPGKEDAGAKFSDYFDHCEAWGKIPSHRALAILRAAKEEVVTVDIAPDPETGAARAVNMVAAAIGISGDGPGDDWLRKAAGWTWRVKLSLSMYVDLMGELRQRAHDEAIAVFARNLKDLLLAAPAGPRPTLGLDPGIRTGVKAAVVDATGKLLETATLYPFQPKNDLRGAQATIVELIRKTRCGTGRHRKRHSQPGDRKAGGGNPETLASSRQAPVQCHRVRGGGVGLFRLGTGGEGVSRSGRQFARSRIHRPPPAGPAGGIGEDHPAIHRRGAVSA